MIISSSYDQLQDLYNTFLGTNETYGEHKKRCQYGCWECAAERLREKKIRKEMAKEPIAGVRRDEVYHLRKMYHSEDSIDHYFESKRDIRDATGQISRSTYLVLVVFGFKDRQIRTHFDISYREWQNFKNQQFPDWANKQYREHIIETEGYKDEAIYEKTHNVRQRRI